MFKLNYRIYTFSLFNIRYLKDYIKRYKKILYYR